MDLLLLLHQVKAMLVDEQDAASDLEVKVLRKNNKNNKLDYFLPDPLVRYKRRILN